MTTQTPKLDMNNPQIRGYAAEFLDARLNGILGRDWTVQDYVLRRLRDESRKQLGLLCDASDDFLEI